MHAKGTFETANWNPQPAYSDHDGVSLAHVTMSKTFEGDLAGTATVSMIVTGSEHEDSRSYVAMERVEGTLGGRAGTFVMQHNAVSDLGTDTLRITVVPGSGTGELTGLRGDFQVHIAPDGSHSYTFDYTLGGAS
ncbi:DUF3224 domain-containing protein [Nonomuraea sp. NPDC050556]|uniref:DUF3224 domain-containing protein n=1 Tax=Nonomuraea sp. NPDC050556 TaxID=3364369 RepID=UPI00378E8BD3